MLDILKNKADKKGIRNIETHCAGFLTYQHVGEPVERWYPRLYCMEGLLQRTGFRVDLKEIEAENHITYVCSKI